MPAAPGQTVEWRVVVSYTGTASAAALGAVYYQPLLVNTDNTDNGDGLDVLGAWRNNGISGQGNTTLAQGLLSLAEGQATGPIANGYGRVRYGFTSRSTTTGNSGPLVGHRHVAGDVPNIGSPPDDIANTTVEPGNGLIRISGTNVPDFYFRSIFPCGIVACFNNILWGVVADNNTASSTWFTPGTQNLVIFRHSLTLSQKNQPRTVAITSEAWSLRRAGGGSPPSDIRFMNWALPGEGGATATIRAGVEYVPLLLSVTNNYPCGDIDFNNDGYFYDPADIDAFFSVYAEGPCLPLSATCDTIDFNNDGGLFDVADIDAFLRVYSEAPC